MEIIPGTPELDELFAGMEDTLPGGAGNDTLDATVGEGGNLLLGQEDDDLLKAGSNDILRGGPGNDQLFGGRGGSTLTGGEGEDGFWIIDGALPEQRLEVTDFVPGTDVLGIRGFTLEEVRSLRIEQIGADTLVQLDGVDIAILRNTVARTLTRDDFAITDEPIEADSLLDEILERGFLRVGTLSDSFSGMGVEMSRAIAVALFDDPDAIEFVVQEFADSFGNTADGIVDISTIVVQNLTRDASLDIDYGPIYFYDGITVLVPADSGVTSVADLDGLTIGMLEASTSAQSLTDAADDAGVEITLETFPTIEAMFAAYDAGEVDGVSSIRSVLVEDIRLLSDPDNQLILDEALSKDPIGMLVPENESEFADVVRWVIYATFQAEEFGITSENVEEFLDSEDPAIARFLGTEGDLGAALGLEEDFVVNIIEEVGNYGEMYARNFDEDIIPRGLNEIWTEGGLIYSPPFSGTAPSDVPLVDNNDRNVLEEVRERGFVRVGVPGSAPGLGFLQDGEFTGFEVDYGRAIAAAVLGDPQAVEFVVSESEEQFSDIANGIVDVTALAITHTLGRDTPLGINYRQWHQPLGGSGRSLDRGNFRYDLRTEYPRSSR